MKNQFSGTGVALITPFRKQGTIDFSTLERLIDNIIENKVDYIVMLGTTSEVATLSHKERFALSENILEMIGGRVPVVMGIGGNDTTAIADTIQKTDFTGISGILSVAPYYNKPQQRGIYMHYKRLAEVSPVPMIIYCNIAAETTLQLAEEFPNIVAVKEASGNMAQIMNILNNKPDGFSVLSGDDALTLPMMSLGATGVISVVANAFPKQMSQMVNYCLKGDFKKALPIHRQLLPIANALFEEGNPSGVKAALEIQGIIESSAVRLPLVKVSKTLYNKLSQLVTTVNE